MAQAAKLQQQRRLRLRLRRQQQQQHLLTVNNNNNNNNKMIMLKHLLPPALKRGLQITLLIVCSGWQLLYNPLGELHSSSRPEVNWDVVATLPSTNNYNIVIPGNSNGTLHSLLVKYHNTSSSVVYRGWNSTSSPNLQQDHHDPASSSSLTRNPEVHSNIHDRDTLVDCGCPNTCTAEVLNRMELQGIDQRSSLAAPFSCKQRIEKYIGDGKTEREACTVAFKEKVTPCDSACDPRQCKAAEVVIPSTKKVLEPVLPTYRGNNEGTKNILIIAAVPRSERHSVALWSELECIGVFYDEIIVSSPKWSRSLMDEIVRQARERLKMNVQARYYVNDRYDVGLWCDAVQQEVLDAADGMDSIKTVTLLNDSVYAFRTFSGILDALSHRPFDLDMVGVNYYNFSDSKWLESVMRGFPVRSIPIFYERICQVANTRPCSKLGPVKRKRCIVETFEIDAAGIFFPNRTMGLFPSNPPSDWPWSNRIWAEQPKFWKELLVEKLGFPLAKVNAGPTHLTGPTDPRLAECTKTMNVSFLFNFNYANFVPR
ncbi:hypothetical protein IV203_009541 [Nitzschia inconspicua]|uniref:Uncharacterized protein n=1 Tax=Nitzschia inconspicua TaxID=303405 RepID=A0A9K3KVC2_9STRA|nr:hypothetical protein IV203_009541 [Nitzschia inconspicua]